MGRRNLLPSRGREALVGGVVLAALVVVPIAMWWRLERHERELLRVKTQVTAGQVAHRLEVYLSTRLGLVGHLVDDVASGRIAGEEQFREESLGVQASFGGFQAINWIEPGGIIAWVVPAEPNRGARGRSVRDHPVARTAFAAAESTGRPRMTRPLALFQGGQGFATYYPVLVDGVLLGYVNAVFRARFLIEDCLRLGVFDEFDFEVTDGGDAVHSHGRPIEGEERPVAVESLPALDRTWTVRLAPNERLVLAASTIADEVLLSFGLSVSVAVALLVVLWRSRREAYRRSEARKISIFERAPCSIVVLDVDGTIVEVNQRTEEIVEYDRRELTGRNYLTLVPEVGREAARNAFQAVVAGEELRDVEIPVETRGGQGRVLLWNALPLGAEPAGILALGLDITDRKRSEEDRQRLERSLLESQKLESLGVLAGGIAHDFNNLLTGILGNVGLAIMKSRPESPIGQILDRIEAAAHRSAELTNQLLAYSGKGRFVVQPIDLSGLVEEMVHLLEAVVSKKAALEFDFGRDLPAVEGDSTQLGQVVMNLITNASDALGDERGVIAISTGLVEADRTLLSGGLPADDLAPGSYVSLEVRDSGSGMDEATVRRIFDPFFTTRRSGRGLGLAAVLGIVRGHRGTLFVDSQPGRGTCFRILLPAVARRAATPAPTVEGGDAWRGSGKILVIDDEETVRDFARMTLESCGFEVLTAAGGQAGVERFRSVAPEVRLVLLDLTMPDLSGHEVLRELRRIRPDVPILLSSGYHETLAASPFAGAEVAAFLQKPYRPGALLDAVRRIVEPVA